MSDADTPTAGQNDDSDIATMSFEQAMKALEQVVNQLESGSAPLEDSIRLYTRGNRLKAHCEDKLKAAEARIEKITLDGDGTPQGTEPLDMDNEA
ncbi:exodeoxyribonuclease VII small subunit [Yunchengibacter salinarum]|uniref:exodeoxyribonuclease VII small subunit n=1 Tax=Yunchengibacter salinarum TaxID=3133399 RepID=UPI0035B5AC09